MSDFASTFFTVANALVSPKAIIKFLSIAILLIATWLYIAPSLSELGIPAEHFSFIILLIGMSLGSFVGIILSLIYDFLFDIYKQSRKKKSDLKKRQLEEKSAQEEQKIRDEILSEKLESSIDYLSINDKHILYLLSQANGTIDLKDYENSILLDNEYMQTISRVDSDRVLVKLNPTLLDIVQISFERYKSTEVQLFLTSNKYAEQLLDLLDVNNSEATTSVHIDVLTSVSGYSRHIQAEYHPDSGFWLSFGRFMFEAFEEQQERKFSEEFLIPSERVMRNSSGADV